MRRPQVGVKAQVKMGAVVPSNVVYQMQERRSMAFELYGAEHGCLVEACLREASRSAHNFGALPRGTQAVAILEACAVVQKRHERIMAAAVRTFDLMTWGRETGLQAI